MTIVDFLKSYEIILALNPDELGIRLLPIIKRSLFGGYTINLQNFLESQLSGIEGCGSDNSGESSSIDIRKQIEIALIEAWCWLEGVGFLVRVRKEHMRDQFPPNERTLSRGALMLAAEADPRKAFSTRRLSKDELHLSLREDVWSMFHRGQYEIAVFAAMKAVEVAVRDASGLSSGLGVDLMRRAFDKASGPLSDMSAPEGEREARAHFFAGAIGSYKNPASHRTVDIEDPAEAAEIIMLASHLLRIVDARRAAARPSQGS